MQELRKHGLAIFYFGLIAVYVVACFFWNTWPVIVGFLTGAGTQWCLDHRRRAALDALDTERKTGA
jgi:uncharacterized membrane protein YgdD (TMEM256/DUF423 family)